MNDMKVCPDCHEACCDCIDGWISVNDRFPPDLHEVMFFYVIYGNELMGQQNDIAKRDIVCGHYEKGSWHICYLYNSLRLNDAVKVTHWRELPEYPCLSDINE